MLLNKSDLERTVTVEELRRRTDKRVIEISAKEELGIEELEKTVKDMFYGGEIDFNDQVYITNERHKSALTEALRSLKMVMESIDLRMPEDFIRLIL